jgi:hypothetical protein
MSIILEALGYSDLEADHQRTVDTLLSEQLGRLEKGKFGDSGIAFDATQLGIGEAESNADVRSRQALLKWLRGHFKSHALFVLLATPYKGPKKYAAKYESLVTKTVQLALRLAQLGPGYADDVYTACLRVWRIQLPHESALLKRICRFEQPLESIHTFLQGLIDGDDAAPRKFHDNLERWCSTIDRARLAKAKQHRERPGDAQFIPAEVVRHEAQSDQGAALEAVSTKVDSVFPASRRETQHDRSPEGRLARIQDDSSADDHSRGMSYLRGQEIVNGLQMRFASPGCLYSRLTAHEIQSAFSWCFRRMWQSPAFLMVLISMLVGRSVDHLVSLPVIHKTPDRGVGDFWLGGKETIALYHRPDLPLHAAVDLDRDDGKNGFWLPLPPSIGKALRKFLESNGRQFPSLEIGPAIAELRKQVSDRITALRLHQSLAESMTNDGVDEAIVALITGVAPEHCAALYYTAVPKPVVLTTFYDHLDSWFPEAKTRRWGSPSELVGSRLRFDPETVSALFREQAKLINGARKGVDVDLEEFHNELALYTFQLLALVSGARSVTEPFGEATDMNVHACTLRLADKNNRQDGSSRLLVLGDIAMRQVNEYNRNVEFLVGHYAVSKPRLAEEIRRAGAGDASWLFLLQNDHTKTLTPKLTQRRLAERWRPPLNWPRHFLRSWFVGQAFGRGVVRAFMGHADTGAPPLSRYDGTSVFDLQNLATAINDFIDSLDIPMVTAWNTPTYRR